MAEAGPWIEDDLSTASDYCRMAMSMLIRRGIPPTPENYALWYLHARNRDPGLSRRLLESCPVDALYDTQTSRSLFLEYVIERYSPDVGATQDGHAKWASARRAFDAAIRQSLSAPEEPTCLVLFVLADSGQEDAGVQLAADRAIQELAGRLDGLVDERLFVSRHDDRTLAIIVNDRLEVAREIAERLCGAACANTLLRARRLSIGLARATPGESASSLLRRAAAALAPAGHCPE